MKLVAARMSRRAVLRTGYAAVIATLAFSAAEAYHIQISVSEHHLEIYRRYADEEKSLSALRRNIWLAGYDVRDFFIAPNEPRAELLSLQIHELSAGDRLVFAALRKLDGGGTYANLESRMNEFWRAVEAVPSQMLHSTQEQDFAFLQRVIVPQREDLYNQIIALGAEGQQRLEKSERAFADTRRAAARNLVLLLALGMLLSLGVAWMSLHHSETLESAAERHYAEIESARSDLQQLSARLLEVEEEGRRQAPRASCTMKWGRRWRCCKSRFLTPPRRRPKPRGNACAGRAIWRNGRCGRSTTWPCCCAPRCSTIWD